MAIQQERRWLKVASEPFHKRPVELLMEFFLSNSSICRWHSSKSVYTIPCPIDSSGSFSSRSTSQKKRENGKDIGTIRLSWIAAWQKIQSVNQSVQRTICSSIPWLQRPYPIGNTGLEWGICSTIRSNRAIGSRLSARCSYPQSLRPRKGHAGR